jgi:MoxR-like ATPase
MKNKFQKLISQTSELVLDKEKEIRLAVTCLLARGHLLIEDMPGVGKTTLVQTLGRLMSLSTKRVQFTIDVLPADILGTQVYHPQEHRFLFHPGAIFSQLLMADELNRASPRSQSALLQAMEEGEVTVDGATHTLPNPFYVIATQNPHQQIGTFPLPESQLDRFLMSLQLNYASAETELRLFQGEDPRRQMQKLQPVLSSVEILTALGEVEKIQLSLAVAKYIGDLLLKSRVPNFEGAPLSTRAGLALSRAAKAWAYLEGRDYAKPEDVQSVLIPVLSHRLGGNHGIKRGQQWAEALQKSTPVSN